VTQRRVRAANLAVNKQLVSHTVRETASAQWLRYCATNRKFDPSWGSLDFFIDIKSFQTHYGPGVYSASNRNEYQHLRGVGGKGGRCVRLATYHYPVPLPRNLGSLTACNPLGTSGPVMGLLYLLLHIVSVCL